MGPHLFDHQGSVFVMAVCYLFRKELDTGPGRMLPFDLLKDGWMMV